MSTCFKFITKIDYRWWRAYKIKHCVIYRERKRSKYDNKIIGD